VLDGYHEADQHQELQALVDQLIGIQPARLHILLASRYEPELLSLSTARARGEVYELGQADLAFDTEDTRELFALFKRPLTADAVELVHSCRGWPLALRALATDRAARSLDPLTPLLDAYLTREVLDRQPPDLQEFLLRTAGLRWLEPDACAAISGVASLLTRWGELRRRCLFLEDVPPGRVRYQPLFRAFLERTAMERGIDQRGAHLSAAEYYRELGDEDGAIHHLLAAGAVEQVTALLEQVASRWIGAGRAEDLLRLLDRLPTEQRDRPELLLAGGAAHRRLGGFDQALRCYERARDLYGELGSRAGQARALRGLAEVYLDTVQPAQAGALIDRALKLLPAASQTERVELLRLQAENEVNRGRPDIALQAEKQAHLTMQTDDGAGSKAHSAAQPQLPPRLLLRIGRLEDARCRLESSLVESSTGLGAHREPALLLAFVDTLLGNAARALAMAERGLIEAQEAGSQLTEAVAHMRAGHAYQLFAPREDTARQHYLRALELTGAVGVARTQSEAYLGLSLLHAHAGDLGEAEAAAREGLRLVEDAGDGWMAALMWLALGVAGATVGSQETPDWMGRARERFLRAGDTYGQAVTALWQALWHIQAREEAEAGHQIDTLLALAKHYGYEPLLTAATLFGPRDTAMLIPLLIRGRARPEHADYARVLLRRGFPTVAGDETVEEYHPGYTLRIQMFGSFRVWRGTREIRQREWGREKSRQLFQLLLTYRGRWLHREQICEWLWPDVDLDVAERQFKVTLNALNVALEPLRPPRTTPFFIRRRGLAYSFAPSYGAWIDVDEFELRTTQVLDTDPELALRSCRTALGLYWGDYLAEAIYDPWALEERERLLARYLAAATSLARSLVERGDFQEAMHLCEEVVQREPSYEEAYRVLMCAQARAGHRSQALRSYARCVQALRNRLGIEPLPETTRMHEVIKRGGAV
ncbi:MAG: transcriptional regulator, partial [Chloroflexota bacterium]|nr:transcriptional regulator [Chloroflexota bacterium]